MTIPGIKAGKVVWRESILWIRELVLGSGLILFWAFASCTGRWGCVLLPGGLCILVFCLSCIVVGVAAASNYE